jgi:hypothetical protein
LSSSTPERCNLGPSKRYLFSSQTSYQGGRFDPFWGFGREGVETNLSPQELIQKDQEVSIQRIVQRFKRGACIWRRNSDRGHLHGFGKLALRSQSINVRTSAACIHVCREKVKHNITPTHPHTHTRMQKSPRSRFPMQISPRSRFPTHPNPIRCPFLTPGLQIPRFISHQRCKPHF